MSQPAPAFSYAQAAKATSSAAPTPPSSEKRPESMETGMSSETSTHGDEAVEAREELSNGQPLSNGHVMHGLSTRKSLVATPKRLNNDHVNPKASSLDQASEPTADTSAPTPPSPDPSSISASTLPKEEGVSATPNASSDSTWEKQSQASQADEKPDENGVGNKVEEVTEKTSEASEKSEGEKAESPSAVWDQLASASQLKEAPLPTVNIWQQRALDLKAKAGKGSKPSTDHVVTAKPGVQLRSQSGSNSPKDDERYGRGDKDSQGPGQFEQMNGHRASKDVGPTNQPLHESKSSEAKPPTIAPLPPSADSISWPTPDTAKDEERRKAQDKTDRSEKGEKEKGSTTRPHGKERWVHVPYVPSAVFNTPLPPSRRGGRQPRGGRGDARGGHMSHGSMSGERSFSGGQSFAASPPTSSPTSAPTERGRGDMGPPPIPRGGAMANRGRRPVSAGPHFNQEQVKNSDSAQQEEISDNAPSATKADSQNPRTDAANSRRVSNATQTEGLEGRRQVSPSVFKAPHIPGRRPPPGETDHESRAQVVPNEHAHARVNGPDRKAEGGFGQHEGYREPGYAHREGRPERGRGGFRSRGGPNGFHGNHVPNSPHANGAPVNHSGSGFPPKPHAYAERQASLPNSASFTSPRREQGPYRPNSRSHSITSPPPAYNRFPSGTSPQNSQLPALQTQLANTYGYEAGHPGIMTAMPYHPFMESAAQQLFGMVSMQMEYYFSIDNLCKDMFLRKHMDAQGFVFLTVLANFNRIKQLTPDLQLVRMVCAYAPSIEFRTGIDGLDRVRKSEDWERWILKAEDRDLSVQKTTPVEFQPPQIPQYDMASAPYAYGQTMGPWLDPAMQQSGWMRNGDVNGHGLDGTVPPFHPAATRGRTHGKAEKPANDGSITSTPLSAAVPEFSPNLALPKNAGSHPVDPSFSFENVFSDEQVQSLIIVVEEKKSSLTPPKGPPFASATSRSFSNGSIDGRTFFDSISAMSEKSLEEPSQTTAANEESNSSSDSPENSLPESVRSQARPTKHLASTPPVFWVKDKEMPITDLPNGLTHASYMGLREDALRQRETVPVGQCHHDMNILYQFWCHFLIRNFNLHMYEEFRQLAFDDATRRFNKTGVMNLIDYYDASILGDKVVPDELVRDYVELVQVEIAREDRTAYEKLRSAWRNGVMNLRNRKKLDQIADPALKAELDR